MIERSRKKKKKELTAEERLYMASQWQLMARKFRKHKLAVTALGILGAAYLLAVFCQFFAPYGKNDRFPGCIHTPPQEIHFVDEQGNFNLRPFVYPLKQKVDPETFARTYIPDKTRKHYVNFFVRGREKYKLLGFLPTNLHFFGTRKGTFFLLGTDGMGRDIFSRILYGARVSLTIPLVGIFFSLVIGVIMGGISGYYGGKWDMAIQRVIEFIMSIPAIPFWMALSAALPADWGIIQVYFAIVLILSLRRWCGVARVIRGQFLRSREEDFVMAAKVAGASERRIIFKHLLPSSLSFLIVHATIMIPGLIIAESALSFLGLGIRPPAVSWGALLKESQNAQTVIMHPWILLPGLFVVIAVLSFNFVGDGMRDAADPYK